jgi:hypothetical protein
VSYHCSERSFPTEDKSDDVRDSTCEELEQVFDKFPKRLIEMLGDYSAKVGRQDILKPTTHIESSHEISNDNGIRAENFATSKDLNVKSITFPDCNIHKFNWTAPHGKSLSRNIV